MRRVVWSVLAGLGVFFIVLGVMFAFYVPGQVIKFPLNEYDKTTLVATGASYFSAQKVTELSGVTLQATSTTRGNVADADAIGSSGTAVWESYAAVKDTTDNTMVQIPAGPTTLAFNRQTGVLVPWRGNTVGGKHVSVSGQGSVWPFGAKKQNYQVYDTTLLKPVTFRYEGTSTVQGIATYTYVATIPPTQVGTLTLPGSLVGMGAANVTLPQFNSGHETYYVDPVTGVPLAVNEDVHQVLEDSSGATKLVLLNADFKTTAATVSAGVSTDNSARLEISLIKVILPIVAIVIGVVLLVVAFFLSRPRPEDDAEEYEEEPVGSPA